jgi:Mrp family chromosome partitioning ATPase
VAQPEVSRLELRVIEAEPISARQKAAQASPPPAQASEPPQANQPAQPSEPAQANQPAQTSLVPRPERSRGSITRSGWAPSPVFVLEEVELPSSLDPRLVVLREPNSVQARNYRLLRHRLLAHSDPRVIAVTSASPGEGKTTCAANLALVLAEETFARVLLIEANMARPSLADVFGYEPADSFVAKLVMARDIRPPYLVAGVRGSHLQLAALPSFVPRDRRLDRMLLGLAVSELRYFYDYIVIDGPSVFESADVDVAEECADGAIITARARKSRRGGLRRTVEQLGPAPLLGVVLLDA